MSDSTDSEFDLEQLFLPSWAKQSVSTNRYANFEGDQGRGDRRGRGGRDRGPSNRRPEGAGRGPRRPEGSRPERGGRDRNARTDRPGRPRDGERPRSTRELAPFPEVEVILMPDDHGVDSLAKQIRMTGRAYPLFEIARMVLQKPDRHGVIITVKKGAEGKPVQPLFTCAIDQSVWLAEEDAVRHVLSKHFDLFYQAERTAIEPPKGVYTFVAQCGMSGVILGPPNHHDYQNQLRKLHARRFARLPFEAFKSRVKIVRDEEVVKKWIEDQSFTTEYNCLNLPEPLKLKNREEVEKHFRETHLANIVQQVDSVRLKGTELNLIFASSLLRLVRKTIEDQRYFPLQVATALSQQFATRGLQFFKVNRTITHVCVARPHFLDMEVTPVSDGIKRIVEYIDSRQRCTRKDLLNALAPAPAVPPAVGPEPPPASTSKTEEGAAESGKTAEAAAPEGSAAAPPTPVPRPAPAPVQPTPEQAEIITDLHWLIHEGHVIEFANGVMETAKKPLPKPVKPKKPVPVAPESQEKTAVEGTEVNQSAAVGTVPPDPQQPSEGMGVEPQAKQDSVAAGSATPESAPLAPPSAATAAPEPEPVPEEGTVSVGEGEENKPAVSVQASEGVEIKPKPEGESASSTDQ